MNKTKKSSLTQTYQQFMELVDNKGLSSSHKILDKEVTGFGSAMDEKIKGIPEVKALVRNQIKQSKGLIITWKIKSFSRYISKDENTALFADDIYLDVKAGKELIKMYLRFSTVLNYINDQWKVIHWHGSKPEQVQSEADTYGIDNLKQKNAELEKLVEEKTTDLTQKNRELEIEASLERVRAVTMAMNTPKDILNICKVFFNELQSLGFKDLRNTLINFWDDVNGQLHDYDYSDFAGGNFAKLAYSSHPTFEEFQKKIRKAKDAFAKLVINKEGLKSWQQRRRSSGEYKDHRLNKISALYYYFYSTGVGALGISTFSPISKEEVEVLKKFRNVFDLAYKRYMDIAKAEAQTKEAQIQLALERVRARTMAMQDSKELSDTSFLLANQIRELGINAWGCAFHIYGENEEGDYEWFSNEDGYLPFYKTPRKKYFKQYFENRHCDEGIFIKEFKGKACATHYDFLMQIPVVGDALRGLIKSGIALPTSQIDHIVYFEYGYLLFITYKPVPEAHHIFKRFTKEFEQTYIRFLDLQKAEAQAREAQIQLALERVRAKTMAMQKSDELGEAAVLLFKQIKQLGIETYASGFNIWDKEAKNLVSWMSNPTGEINPPFEMPIESFERHRKIYAAWKKHEVYYEEDIKDDALVKHYKFLRSFPLLDEAFKKSEAAGIATPDRQVHNVAFFKQGFLLFITLEPHPEWKDIFIRFANVFEQTYTRFNDLKQAEAQAKEAQIAAALEKVRSRSMGMQKSEELREVIRIVYEQLIQLNIHVEHAGFLIDYKKGDNLHIWLADEHLAPSEVIFPWFDCPPNNAIREAKEKGEEFFFYHLNFEEKNKFYRDLFNLIPGIPEETVDYYFKCPGLAGSGVLLESIGLYIENFSGTVYSEEENAVLMRFGKVFQQTYTRFLDLQKAEAQAREAQIEAALERVRARTMAMQKSSELNPTADLLFEQLRLLGAELQGVAFAICDKDSDIVQKWTSIGVFSFPYTIEPAEQNMYEAWKNKVPLYEEVFEGVRIKKYYETLMEVPAFKQGLQQLLDAGIPMPTWQKNHAVSFQQGYLLIITTKPFAETQIFIRFGKVFEQTYTRFLDLQKAEMQAREAKIEVSLEKVRTVALILKKSDEMLDVVQALYEALYDLGFSNIRNSIIDVHNPQKETFLDYDYSPQLGRSITEMSYYDSPFIENQVRKTEADNDAFFELILEGQELQELIDMRLKNGEAEDIRLRQTKQLTYNLYSFGNGAIGISNFGLLSDEQKEILKRFRNVFAFAYKRYSDMVQAEALAREAKIEAALEKVRSRTLAMQKSDELAETAAVLFQQLIILGIAPNRLFIIIMKTDSSELEAWVTDEDGSKVSIGFTTNYQNNSSIKKMYQGWQQQKKSLVIDMQGEELQQYFHYLHDELKVPFKGGLEQKRRIQHLAYFSHGLIGMASPEEQPAETIPLLERFAAVFNLTFTRFNDLKMAEAHAIQAEQDLIAIKEAKQKAEEALTELQSTQKQLIQSEKMASLGELTAGIAHEIQNPLNFVNNFSEVSNELIEELRMRNDALRIDDTEIKNLLSDIGQNLEKINHHGQRAADIVKGMLQHSRSNTGQKEWTDINALCDEYLRLAYHGLRAKDKSFNAKFETSFDESIGKINIVPQEIGRVILNLINNAFYAVSDKKKITKDKYEPTVIVSTKKENGNVLITVKDNGNGIPATIKEKIFQPFFTTKPTGSGTGLGLSLSYDIVKAHGGEIKVDTKEGADTTFIILLPIKE